MKLSEKEIAQLKALELKARTGILSNREKEKLKSLKLKSVW